VGKDLEMLVASGVEEMKP